jgi:hypothetical protein
MPDLRRLMQFIESAPAGTMVPVESLREMLLEGAVAPEPAEPPRLLTPAEAADWLHAQLGGRKRTAAAIPKVMRTGFRGVVLKSYPYGRERGTTEADLRVYVWAACELAREIARAEDLSLGAAVGRAGDGSDQAVVWIAANLLRQGCHSRVVGGEWCRRRGLPSGA